MSARLRLRENEVPARCHRHATRPTGEYLHSIVPRLEPLIGRAHRPRLDRHARWNRP
jgi:hypothetical protein